MPCPTHIRGPWQGSTREARLPPRWKKLRARILRRDRHLCTWVEGGQRCTARATEVDHIVLDGGDHESNLRSLCHPHHATKSGREGAEARKRRALEA